MKRKKGQMYYYINSVGEAQVMIEHFSKEDDKRHKIGNYFNEKDIREQLQSIEEIGFLGWFKGITKR